MQLAAFTSSFLDNVGTFSSHMAPDERMVGRGSSVTDASDPLAGFTWNQLAGAVRERVSGGTVYPKGRRATKQHLIDELHGAGVNSL